MASIALFEAHQQAREEAEAEAVEADKARETNKGSTWWLSCLSGAFKDFELLPLWWEMIQFD